MYLVFSIGIARLHNYVITNTLCKQFSNLPIWKIIFFKTCNYYSNLESRSDYLFLAFFCKIDDLDILNKLSYNFLQIISSMLKGNIN